MRMYCGNTNANFEMNHQALQNSENSQASSSQQRVRDCDSSLDENIMNDAIPTTTADNFFYGDIDQYSDVSLDCDNWLTGDIIEREFQALLNGNPGLATEKSQSSFCQQQILDFTSNLNVPAANGAIPKNTAENLIFQAGSSQNLESYRGIGQDRDLSINGDYMNIDKQIAEAFKAPHVEHQGLTTENSQATFCQQQILDSTPNLIVPATNGEILIESNPNLQTVACFETSEINQNAAQDLNFTNSLDVSQMYNVIFDKAGNATRQRVLNANSYQPIHITNDVILPRNNSNLLTELDQNIQAIEVSQSPVQNLNISRDKPMTNDIRFGGTSNANFQEGVTELQNLATMENISPSLPQQRSLDLKCGDTNRTKLQTEVTQRQYVQIVQTNEVSYWHSSFDFTIERNRLKSLLYWINKYVSKEKLARAGFFYNHQRDYLECYFCKVVIGSWGIGDDPLMEHFKHSPKCVLINLKCTENVPNDEMLLNNELNEMQQLFNRMQLKADLMPRHPDFKNENTRLQSFANWPKSMAQKKEELSAAGFFYLNSGDDVKCFDCGGCLTQWEETDIPLEEHKRHFGNKCQFIQNNYSRLKRKRPHNKEMSNASKSQMAAMLKFMNEHTQLKAGSLHLQDKQLFDQLWSVLAELLNRLDGPYKTIDGWKQSWHDRKSNEQRKTKRTLTTSQIPVQLPSPMEPNRAAESRLEMSPFLAQNLQLQLDIQKMENQRLQHEIQILKLENQLDNLKQQSGM